jgi:hypothetical protein
MPETFYKGNTQILYIFVEGIKIPVACLTDNSISRQVDFLETTTQDNGGWKTGQPLNKSYRISFSGVQIESNFAAPTKASLDILEILFQNGTLFNWTIETESTFIDGGSGRISTLTDSSSAEGLLTFTGEILGHGAMLVKYLAIPDNYIFQNGDNYIFQDSNNYIFQ